MENIPEKVILHCSASPDTSDGSVHFSYEDCDRYHKSLGWDMCGYQYYIERDGTLHKGRDEQTPGAHTIGQNKKSIGVCYEGSHLPTVAQVKTLCDLYRQIRSVHGFDWADWYPHNDFKNKECPGFPIDDIMAIFRKLP